jgi:hypothetical protein
MPFQSEKQRRYLWANEPEIARDWTDTYGSRIQKNNGGIMRLGFAEGDIVDDQGNVFEETTYTDLTEDQFNERFGGEYEENLTPWYQEDTLVDMWNDPNRPQISKGLETMRDWATDKFSTGIDWGRMAMQGIGNMIMPGLGWALGAIDPNQRRGYNYSQGRFNTQAEYEANRAARQHQSRINNLLSRQAAGKSYSQKNLNELTMGSRPGFYGNQATVSAINRAKHNIGMPENLGDRGNIKGPRSTNTNSPAHPSNRNPGSGGGIGSAAAGRGPAGGSIGASRSRARGGRMSRGGIAGLWPR